MTESGIDDPLFRPIDANDFAERGADADDYTNLREFGLIRIRLHLPANIKLVDPESCTTNGEPAPCDSATSYALSDAEFTDVWRAVPSVVNAAISGKDASARPWPRGPNQQGGFLSDARASSLEEQAHGAFSDHAEISEPPTAADLADIAAYERTLVAAPEPELDELESEGKEIFKRACMQCHNGPSMSTPVSDQGQQLLRFHDIHTDCPRPSDAAETGRWSFAECPPGLEETARTYEISFADGFKLRRTSTDPGRALLTGYVASGRPAANGSCAHAPCAEPFEDDWQKFDVAPLHGISKTAPYFHNNSAETLEAVVVQYEEFYKHDAAVAPDDAPPVFSTDGVHRDRPNVESERAALVAYLERL